MANEIRIKRRLDGGGAGAPATLLNAELAYNEQTDTLYYGKGISSGDEADSIIAIAGSGVFAPINSPAFTGIPTAPTAAADTDTTQLATTAFVLGQAATTAALDLGTASFGSSEKYARADHVHRMPLLNEIGLATSSVSLNSQKITNLGTPTSDADAATKLYVDDALQASEAGLKVKTPARVATTEDITLSGIQTIDTVEVEVGDIVLVLSQTDESENGIYIVASGAWTRSTEADTWEDLVSAYILIMEGSLFDKTSFYCNVLAGGTLGTTAVTFVPFQLANDYQAGTGLTLTGNTFSITNTSVTANSYGAADKTLSATVNAQGQLTALSEANIAIANTQVSGLGTMSTQNAGAVAITGGAIDNVTIDGGSF